MERGLHLLNEGGMESFICPGHIFTKEIMEKILGRFYWMKQILDLLQISRTSRFLIQLLLTLVFMECKKEM